MAVCVTWVSYANLYILMALYGNAVSPCIPMKLAICIAWKYQYVWHMSVICNISLLWNCRISSALGVEMLQPFIKLLMCMWKYSLPPLVREWMHICWLKYHCLNQRWLFLEYYLWIILGKPWMITAEIPWYLQIYVLGPVTSMFPGIQPMSSADREPAPDRLLSGFGTLCCV